MNLLAKKAQLLSYEQSAKNYEYCRDEALKKADILRKEIADLESKDLRQEVISLNAQRMQSFHDEPERYSDFRREGREILFWDNKTAKTFRYYQVNP